MSKENSEQLIKKTTQEVLDKMGFEAKISITNSIDNNRETFTVEIDSPDSKFIIGKHGNTLVSLQHILKLLVRAKTDKYINFFIDINGYTKQQDDYIGNIAREMAEEALVNGRAITLEPMNAYERRLVHLELEKNEKVKTESIGEDDNRKVIISPIRE